MKVSRAILAKRGGRGFSFTEILFAIMLLGLGFVLIAGMLPVAAVQTQDTVDQTIASQIAKNAAESVETIASNATMPPTIGTGGGSYRPYSAPIWSFADGINLITSARKSPGALAAWTGVKGKMIYEADPRYAFTVMFSRDRPASDPEKPPSFAQLYILVTRVRTRDRYSVRDLDGLRPNLRPREVMVKLTEGTKITIGKDPVTKEDKITSQIPGPDIIEFIKPTTGDYANVDTPSAVAEGCFVLISEDRQRVQYRPYATQTSTTSAEGLGNGRIYRVGNRRPDLGPNKWELMPGFDMAQGTGAGGPGPDMILNTADDDQNIPVDRVNPRFALSALAYILGRASVDPGEATEFEGPSQDIALFSTMIPVK